MKKVSFRVRNFDKEQFLTYNIENDAVLDEEVLDFLEDEEPKGLVPIIFEEGEEEDTFSYNVTDKIRLCELSNQEINAEMVLMVMRGLVLALIDMAEYRIPLSYLVLHRNYIYINSEYEVEFICIPLEEMKEETDLNVFLRNFIASLRFDACESGDYVARLLTYINTPGLFNMRNLVTLIEELMDTMGIAIPEDSSADIYVDYEEVLEVAEEAEETEEVSQAEEKEAEEVPRAEVEEAEEVPQAEAEELEEVPQAEVEELEEVPQAEVEEAEEVPQAEAEELEEVPQAEVEEAEEVPQAEAEEIEEVPQAEAEEIEEVPQAEAEEIEEVVQSEAEEIEDTTQAQTGAIFAPETETMTTDEEAESIIESLKKQVQEAKATSVKTEEKVSPKKPTFKTRTTSASGVIQDDFEEFLAEQELEERRAKREETGLKIKKNIKVNRASVMMNTQEESRQLEMTKEVVLDEDDAEEEVVSNSILSQTIGATGILKGADIPKAMPYLVRVNTEERVMITKQTFKIGKASMGVDYTVKGNSAVSRVHAIITSKDDVYYVKDNKSTNHTFVNGKILDEGDNELLTHDCKIVLGDEEFVFKLR